MKKLLFTIITLHLFVFLPGMIFAQILSHSDLVISSSTKYPSPYEDITLLAEYYLSDMDKASVSWYENGVLKNKGGGETGFTFKTSGVGKTTTIRVTVLTQEGKTLSQTKNFTPVLVNLLWEADTYTPPFYRGKALASSESKIRVTAVPDFRTTNGTQISPDKLFYEWSQVSSASRKASQGKNYTDITNATSFGETSVSVTVSNSEKSLIQKKTISIPITQPEIVFYSFDPLAGPNYLNALVKETSLEENQIGIKGEPYFVNKNTLSRASYVWTSNNQPLVSDSINKSIVTFAKKDGNGKTSGALTLSLRIEYPNTTNQRLQGLLKINF